MVLRSSQTELLEDQPHEREASPDLPALPPQRQNDSARTRGRPILPVRVPSSRKRPLFATHSGHSSRHGTSHSADTDAELAAAFNTSSDPAFFSSDETPGLENYAPDSGNKRKKKVYSGTWWSGRLRSGSNHSSRSSGDDRRKTVSFSEFGGKVRRKRDREFKRNIDSGIFMADELEMSGSSGADLSSDGLLDELETQRGKTLETLQSRGYAFDLHESHPPKTTLTRPFKKLALQDIITNRPSPLDIRVNEIVQQCLEKGGSDVDLTNMGIEMLPQSITDLRTLVKSRDPINLSFAPLSSRLRIYLANNHLSLFPGQLLKVTNIELLSLRQNQFTTLPDGIIDLKHLRELNISSNRFEYLPFSILQLCDIKLKKIQSEPNPWISMPSSDDQLSGVAQLILNQPGRSIRRIAVGTATAFEANGTIRRSLRLAQAKSTSSSPRQPSLSEMVLRQLNKLHSAGTDLSTSPDTELCSDSVRDMLHQLYRYQHEGRRICTFCEQATILPRYEWLEWWRIVDFDLVRGETNPSPRYEITIAEDRRKDSTGSDEDSGEENEDRDGGEEEKEEDGSGLVLPFMRVSCGCRTQADGLEEERQLFESLAKSYKEKDNTGYRTWPSLAARNKQ